MSAAVTAKVETSSWKKNTYGWDICWGWNIYSGWWFPSTHLKNMIVKMGLFPQLGMKIKNIWKSSRKLTYPTWGKGKSSTQICQKSGGYVNSLEGTPPKTKNGYPKRRHIWKEIQLKSPIIFGIYVRFRGCSPWEILKLIYLPGRCWYIYIYYGWEIFHSLKLWGGLAVSSKEGNTWGHPNKQTYSKSP